MPEIEEIDASLDTANDNETKETSTGKETENIAEDQKSNEVEDKETSEPQEDSPDKEFFNRISKDDVIGVTQLLNSGIGKVDMVDEHGMTPLQHAAYRGNKEMCQLLLDRGADVNGGNHNNGYTALHFAALSGNPALCQLLLQHGAKSHAQNSVGRTAAQMAAFVGNHDCVSTINNFISSDDVDYFTVPQGLEKKAKLNPACGPALHQLIMQVNFHPVKVAVSVKKNGILLEHIPEVINVLSLMAGREMNKGLETNEIAAFKLHMLSHVLSQIQKGSKEAKGKDPIDYFVKRLLKTNVAGAIPDGLDRILREGVRAFPYYQTTIMQQLVANLTHTKHCEEPGAWGIICSVVNGQKGFRDNNPCSTCGEEKGSKVCSRCHFDAYCNQECQKIHWFVHKKYCKEKAAEWEASEAKRKEEEEKSKKPEVATGKENQATKEKSKGEGKKK